VCAACAHRARRALAPELRNARVARNGCSNRGEKGQGGEIRESERGRKWMGDGALVLGGVFTPI
jgi:hypothetical protein